MRLRGTGKIRRFWMNSIKSFCYAQFDNAEIADLEGSPFGMVHVAGACAIAGIMGAFGFHMKPRLVYPAGARDEEEGLSVPFNV